MKARLKTVSLVIGLAAALGTTATLAQAGGHVKKAPFGGAEDVAFSKDVWAALAKARLVGANAINVKPFEGNEPHGSIQQVLDTTITVRGRSGRIIVKRNNGGKGVTIQSVHDDPAKDLKAITVMFKREKGYDPADLDWMWIKFKPDGALFKNPKGMLLSGRIAKGMNVGCIACHKGGGANMEFLRTK